jgi:hypothetical protein
MTDDIREDARFEDGAERPLKLVAADSDDLQVISSLVQDAVFPVGEMTYSTKARRFAMLINRFRWEDALGRRQDDRAYERTRAVLVFDDVSAVKSSGLERDDPELVMSLLSVAWHPAADGAGQCELILAGDGAIALDMECINVTLQDVTRPYLAPSGKMPTHPE